MQIEKLQYTARAHFVLFLAAIISTSTATVFAQQSPISTAAPTTTGKTAIRPSRPQTLYGIADSPVGLAAWLLDHNDADGQPAATVAAALNRTTSTTGELTRDEILDNITLYWLTNTGVSASRLYWEYKGGFFNAKGVSIPVAVSVFPGEQYEAPRSWTERAYPKLIYYNKLDRGGHFAAWEQPQLFSEELRAAFRSLR